MPSLAANNMDPLLMRLRTEECRKKELIAELDAHLVHVVELDKVQLKRDLRTRVAHVKRAILRKLLVKPLSYEVIEENGKPGVRITGGNLIYTC
jgi:hypothetical protein